MKSLVDIIGEKTCYPNVSKGTVTTNVNGMTIKGKGKITVFTKLNTGTDYTVYLGYVDGTWIDSPIISSLNGYNKLATFTFEEKIEGMYAPNGGVYYILQLAD